MFRWFFEKPRFFKKPRLEAGAQLLTALDKSNETLEMLKKKEKLLQEKAFKEAVKAKKFTTAKDKRVAMRYLKRKRLYEQQIEQLGNFQLRIHEQMMMMEGAKAVTETVDALRTGAAAMKAMQKAKNIHNVEKVMDEVDQQCKTVKRLREAVSAPSGASADCDEDELEAEFGQLEGAELEEQLLLPAATASAAPVDVIAGLLPGPPGPQATDKEDELADEMAF